VSRRGPHEGTIYQRKDGRWTAGVSLGYGGGRRIRKFVTGGSRREVAEKLEPLLRARRDRLPIPDQRQKLGPFLLQWLEEVARPTVRWSTYKSYRDIVRLHLEPDLGRIPVAKLTPFEVQRFVNAKLASGLSPRRVQYLHAVLRRALVSAERWGLASRNVAKLADPPRVPHHEIRPLTPEDAHKLIDASCDDRLRALYVCALGTGMRQGELLALRWDDVDLDAQTLSVRHTLARVEGRLVRLEPKSDRSRRTLVLPETVLAALRPHRTRQLMDRLVAGRRWVDSGHVFTTTIGTPIEAAAVSRAFHHALDRAGLPRSRFHDLRHAAATFLLAQGLTLEDAKNMLGHSSITLTSNTYGHVLEKRQRQVAAAMDVALGHV
jgi:integrase